MSDFFVTSDTSEVRALMDQLRDKAENPEDLLERVGNVLLERSEERFATNGDGEWEPLKEATRTQKERRGFSTEILVRSGALRDSYTRKGARGNIFEISGGRLRYGSSLDYASRHQTGDANVPKRQVIVVDEELEIATVREAIEELGDFF